VSKFKQNTIKGVDLFPHTTRIPCRIRVLVPEYPALALALVDSLSGEISSFFNDAERHYSLSTLDFFVVHRDTKYARYEYVNNIGQSRIIVTPKPEVFKKLEEEIPEVEYGATSFIFKVPEKNEGGLNYRVKTGTIEGSGRGAIPSDVEEFVAYRLFSIQWEANGTPYPSYYYDFESTEYEEGVLIDHQTLYKFTGNSEVMLQIIAGYYSYEEKLLCTGCVLIEPITVTLSQAYTTYREEYVLTYVCPEDWGCRRYENLTWCYWPKLYPNGVTYGEAPVGGGTAYESYTITDPSDTETNSASAAAARQRLSEDVNRRWLRRAAYCYRNIVTCSPGLFPPWFGYWCYTDQYRRNEPNGPVIETRTEAEYGDSYGYDIETGPVDIETKVFFPVREVLKKVNELYDNEDAYIYVEVPDPDGGYWYYYRYYYLNKLQYYMWAAIQELEPVHTEVFSAPNPTVANENSGYPTYDYPCFTFFADGLAAPQLLDTQAVNSNGGYAGHYPDWPDIG